MPDPCDNCTCGIPEEGAGPWCPVPMKPRFRTRLGTEGGQERVILVTGNYGFYLAVRVLGRYYRLAIWEAGWRWHASRS